MILTNTPTSTYTPAPPGVHDAVCVDFIDLGIVDTPFGAKRKVKLTFEIPAEGDGKPYNISKTFTASLHEKASLNHFLSKWRGKPIAIGEPIDFRKVVGTSATLVVAQETNDAGKTFAKIDTIMKATRKITPTGEYDAAKARENIAKWAKEDATTRQTQPPTQGAPSRAAQPAAPAAAVAKTAPASPIADDDVPF